MFDTDVIGYTLGEAKELIARAGLAIHAVRLTNAPRIKLDEYRDDFRVIRSKIVEENKLELVVCKPL